MNCKEAHLLIAGLTGDELPDELIRHAKECSDCAALIKWDAQLRNATRALPSIPTQVLTRIQAAVAEPSAPRNVRWLELLRRNLIMKITLPVAAVLAAAIFFGIPRPANATGAIVAFRKMKSAVLAKAKDMTSLGFKVRPKSNGQLGMWVVINGELTELKTGTSFHSNQGGKEITVVTRMGGNHDVSSLPPEVQAEVQKAIEQALSGQGSSGSNVKVFSSAMLNGKSVDMKTLKAFLKQQGIDFNLDIDLNESHYRTIAYGKDPGTLVLTPVTGKDRHLIVQLDSKSNLPKTVRLEELKDGRWVNLRRSNVTLL